MSIEQNEGGMGPLIGSIIIVLLIAVGGYYSFVTSSTAIPKVPNYTSDSVTGQPAPAISVPAKPVQESTEIGDIEEDAKAVDTASIDTSLENLDLLVNN